jgi:hypothetical protein
MKICWEWYKNNNKDIFLIGFHFITFHRISVHVALFELTSFEISENRSTWISISSIVDCQLSNFEMKIFQNIAKPSEAKKNINDNFYFLWNSFLQRLSKMITKSLPQQSFFYIISIEKRSKRFGMNWYENENECRNELDCWFLILFDFRTKLSQNGNVCWCKWRKRRHGYMENTFNTIPFPFPFPSKYSLVGCHGDGGTVSRNNVRTTIFQLLRNRRKWRQIPTSNFIRFYCRTALHYTVASVDWNLRKRLQNLEGNQNDCAISSRIRMK